MYKKVNATNETVITGRKFRIDKRPNAWERFCGWHITNRPFTKAVPINNEKMQKEN